VTVDGNVLLSEEFLDPEPFDLVVAACAHSALDVHVLEETALLLDAIYGLAVSGNRFVP
jgi:hypothetical protein